MKTNLSVDTVTIITNVMYLMDLVNILIRYDLTNECPLTLCQHQ